MLQILNHLLTGHNCWGWELRKDKFALEDKEPRRRESFAQLLPDGSRDGRPQARRWHLDWIRGHGRAGGLQMYPHPGLPWCWPLPHPMYSRQPSYPRQCEVSIFVKTITITFSKPGCERVKQVGNLVLKTALCCTKARELLLPKQTDPTFRKDLDSTIRIWTR